MLKFKLDPGFSTNPNDITGGYVARGGQVEFGGLITTIVSLDNRELKKADGIIQLSLRGKISNIDPQSTLSDNLIMLFGDERDQHFDFLLFDQQFTEDVTFTVDIQFNVVPYSYDGSYKVSFSNGESFLKPFFIPSGSENNFTAIRLKTTKQSNSNVFTELSEFNYILHK